MNGLVKIPMQFFILLIGVLVFTFYQFYPSPVFFNKVEVTKIEQSPYRQNYKQLEQKYERAHAEKKELVNTLVTALHTHDQPQIDQLRIKLQAADLKSKTIREQVKTLMKKNDPKADTEDANYIFLSFVTQQLPVGVVGLLMAVIFLAAMGSTASGLNSLASTSVVDFYKRLFKKEGTDQHYLSASRWLTVFWGLFCILVAFYASKLGNLIEAVNILGSLFYGTILGIFLVAFYMKRIDGTAVFVAALIAEVFVVYAWIVNLTAFLWLNVIGCVLVMLFAFLIQLFIDHRRSQGF